MNYKPYPEYKDSGMPWLGKIPKGWYIKPLKFLCRRSALYGLNESSESYSDDGVRFIRTSDIDDFGNLLPVGVYLDEALVIKYILHKGDLLLSRSGTIGRSFLFAEENIKCAYAGYLVRYIPNKQLYPKFAFYFTKSKSYSEWLISSTISTTIGNVNGQKFANLLLPAPSYIEQKLISSFLDNKILQIDMLIVKKEKLLNLLAEKRQALITQAVTKGLNSNVTMKDSGVDWLGKTPAHWRIMKLKFLSSYIGSGKTPKGGAEVYLNEGIMLIRSQNVHDESLILDDVVYISEAMNEQQSLSKVRERDILLNITGASLGRANFVPDNFPPANVNQHVCIIRPKQSMILHTYLHLLLSSKIIKDQILSYEKGSSREGLNFQEVAGLLLPIPPKDEQQQLFLYLKTQLKAIKNLKYKINKAITTFQEYRTALITNAVTGKIDVRDFVAKELNACTNTPKSDLKKPLNTV